MTVEFQLESFLDSKKQGNSEAKLAFWDQSTVDLKEAKIVEPVQVQKQINEVENNIPANDLLDDPEQQFQAFYALCNEVKDHFKKKFNEDTENWVKMQKDAILGYPDAVNDYINVIKMFLDSVNKWDTQQPPWYDELTEGIFHENWGLAGLQKWVKNKKSSSCKVIQPRIYFMENGVQVLQPQKLSENRFNQLVQALLMTDSSKRKNDPYQEVYMIDGTRIEILNNTKQPTIIFRKYVVSTFTFENIAKLKTIDPQAIPIFKAMVKCGFNVSFIGPVRSGKTTFLTTYQSYEDPTLEGVLVETDPEIPLHEIMPTAPIIQMVADNENLDLMIKPLMRSDGDYLIMGEARDGRALRLMVNITEKGTRRVKGTFHSGHAQDFCFDVAQAISGVYNGDVWTYMIQAAKGFHFLFEFASATENKGQKKLKGIHEIRMDPATLLVSTNMICYYNSETNDWEYNADLSERIVQIGLEEDPEALELFVETLVDLSISKPMVSVNPHRISPFSRLIPVQNSSEMNANINDGSHYEADKKGEIHVV